MKEERRFDFSDYSEEQQNLDEMRHRREVENLISRELYIMRVNGDWGIVMPKKYYNHVITADSGVQLGDFINEVRKDLEEVGIKPHFHCIKNFGIETEIAKQQLFNKIMLDKSKQK